MLVPRVLRDAVVNVAVNAAANTIANNIRIVWSTVLGTVRWYSRKVDALSLRNMHITRLVTDPKKRDTGIFWKFLEHLADKLVFFHIEISC